MFNPGDVIWFLSDQAGKAKFHLCVCSTGKFLFINSPKTKAYPGDFNVPCADIDCLDPTPEGYSIISCTHLTTISDNDLKRLKAKKKGAVANKLLILEGLADWA
jgi:hypothetical protein